MGRWIAFLLVFNGVVSAVSFSQVAGCVNSPDDESSIEYFNLLNFNDDFLVAVKDQASSFQVSLGCPQRESPTIPPSSFRISLSASPSSAVSGVSTCDGGSVVIQKDQLSSGQISSCDSNSQCRFALRAENSDTQAVYSQTELLIPISSNQVISPELEPATMPICDRRIEECLTSADCALSASTGKEVNLCESSQSCLSPPHSHESNYNENLYLE